jgi:hypothetical protein
LFKSLQHDFAPSRPRDFGAGLLFRLDHGQGDRTSVALDEERLAAVLRSKLIEIAQANGPSDAEALRDMLLDRRPASEPWPVSG